MLAALGGHGGVLNAEGVGSFLPLPRARPRAASATVLQTPSCLSSDGASHGEETSVPNIHHPQLQNHPQQQPQQPPHPRLSTPQSLLRRPRSSSADTVSNGGGYSSLSTVDPSSSVLTATGGHSDPFVVERRFCKEPPLTRILATTPAYKRAPSVSPAAAATSAEEDENGRGGAAADDVPDTAQLRRFPTGNTPAADLVIKAHNPPFPFLRTPVTPGEKGYSPDPSDDHANDTSLADSHDSVTGEDTERSVTPPHVGSPRHARQHGGSPLYELPTTVFVGPSTDKPAAGAQSSEQQQQQQQGSTQSGGSTQSQQGKSARQRRATLSGRTRSASSGSHHGDAATAAAAPAAAADASYDEDPSLLHVDPLPKSEDTSIILDSMESPNMPPSQQASSYYDPFPRSKTYGEWLRTNTTAPSQYPSSSLQGSSGAVAFPGAAAAAGGKSGGPSGLVAATPPWSHDDPNETTNFLGTTTSVSEADRDDVHHDDAVLVRLSLPSSVCIPVVAVRLHALQLLHPLLHALTIPYNMPLFTSDSAEDEDEVEGALRAAAHVSPFTSDLVNHAAAPDYATAVQVITDAIHREEETKLNSTTTAPPSVEPSTDDVANKPSPATASTAAATGVAGGTKDNSPAAPASMQPRDLSILYTIRSHLYFHMSPEHLYNSLKDAERALASCPTQEHVCNTYEVLTACLISFGHTAQVERVAAHLRHRCRTPTPLLTRLGRVTQVMVSYGTLFLRQQLNPALLRHGALTNSTNGGGSGSSSAVPADSSKGSRPFLYAEGVQSTPLDGRAYLSRGTYPGLGGGGSPSSPAHLRNAGGNASAASAAANSSLYVSSSATAMPLVVVGGGIVDPPVAGQSAAVAPRTLPYEVCPLLLGYYGKSLHRPSDVSTHAYPPPLSPRIGARSPSPSSAAAAAGAATTSALIRGGAGAHRHISSGGGSSHPPTTQHSSHHHHRLATARPSNDVCHRRLFLLETLFPSAMPMTAVHRLQAVSAIPRASIYRGAGNSRGYQTMRRSLAKAGGAGGGDADAAEAKGGAAKNEKRIKPEDFMYDRDSMLALLATTAETAIPYGTISMRYFGRHIRLSATRRIPKGETVLLERPALLLALWPLPPPRSPRRGTRAPLQLMPLRPSNGVDGEKTRCSVSSNGGGNESTTHATTTTTTAAKSASTTAPRRSAPVYCAHCGRQRLARIVYCPARCGAAYCSEACRREALRLHHVVECGGVADPPPLPSRGPDDNDDTRVRRAVAALQDIFAEWDTFNFQFATWDTPATRCATPVASCSPSASVASSPQEGGLDSTTPVTSPEKATGGDGHAQHGHASSSSRSGDRRSPPPILAVTGLRAMSRLTAMMLCVVLPVENLPELRSGNESLLKAWTEERHAMVRAVAQTLRFRGLMVPASTRGSLTNLYCSGVDPHRLLLLEVILQQLSIPFFADFTYRSSSTVWEALNEFPCAVQRKATPNGRATTSGSHNTLTANSNGNQHYSSSAKSAHASFDNFSSAPTRTGLFPFAGRVPLKPPPPGQRHWFVELTFQQREEMMCTTHRLLQRIHEVVRTELEDVFVLPLTAPPQKGDDDATAGAPLHWTCPELLGFLSSTRVFEELFDFCLTSCAVMYPQDVEPDNAAGISSSGSSSPTPSSHSRVNAHGEAMSTAAAAAAGAASGGGFGGLRRAAGGSAGVAVLTNADRRHGDVTPAVPLAVISPWTCLTVDLHPILGHGSGGVIYSRFMVEHEQRRRMIAYCAAAATRRGTGTNGSFGGGGGGLNLGASGYGSGLEDDSFLSIHSMASASAAAVLGGSALSPGQEELGRSSSMRDDWNIQMLEDAANRSCANLRLSLVHSLPSSDQARPPTVAVMMTAKKSIQLGDVLWWESLNFGEYLHALF